MGRLSERARTAPHDQGVIEHLAPGATAARHKGVSNHVRRVFATAQRRDEIGRTRTVVEDIVHGGRGRRRHQRAVAQEARVVRRGGGEVGIQPRVRVHVLQEGIGDAREGSQCRAA